MSPSAKELFDFTCDFWLDQFQSKPKSTHFQFFIPIASWKKYLLEEKPERLKCDIRRQLLKDLAEIFSAEVKFVNPYKEPEFVNIRLYAGWGIMGTDIVVEFSGSLIALLLAEDEEMYEDADEQTKILH